MFDEIDTAFSPGSGLLQLLASCVAAIVAWVTVEGAHDGPDGPIEGALVYLALMFTGVILALAISHFVPGSSREGRWIWIVPTVPEVLLATFILVNGPGSLRLLIYVRPDDGDQAYGLLITYPAWACCCYSATMSWCYRRLKRLRNRERE